MSRSLVFIFSIWFSCSSQPKEKPMRFTQTPILYNSNDYLTTTYNESFFKERHFNYTNFAEGDTTKHFYTSETIIIEDTAKYFFRNCKAIQNNDSLSLQFSDALFSANSYELRILKVNNQITSEFYQAFSVTDSSYKPPVFKTVKQNIILDKNSYVIGDSLRGKLSIEVLASYFWEHKYTDTVHIYGLIRTTVE